MEELTLSLTPEERFTRAVGPARKLDLAEQLRISIQALNRYKTKGVPPGRLIEFCDLTDWRLSPVELRPDMFPPNRVRVVRIQED